MTHKYIKCLAMLLCAASLLAGCAASVRESDIADKTYLYEKDGFGGIFTITINGDGTFSYYEGPLSSIIGNGAWTLDGDTLLLSDSRPAETPCQFYFKVDGDDLVFLKENSSDFLFVKVSDGDKFSEISVISPSEAPSSPTS